MPPAASVLSVPNIISLTRIVFAIAFIVAQGTAARVALIIAASASDFLDGWIARRQNITTKWGALIDPITDRAFVFAAVSSYVWRGELTTGQYFTLISRDLMTAIGFLVARAVPWLRPVQFKARMSGKITTVLQLITLFAVLVAPSWVRVLVIVVGIASAIAIVDYTLMLWRHRVR
jgi:cardiolipin synthase (CMP-forming)